MSSYDDKSVNVYRLYWLRLHEPRHVVGRAQGPCALVLMPVASLETWFRRALSLPSHILALHPLHPTDQNCFWLPTEHRKAHAWNISKPRE